MFCVGVVLIVLFANYGCAAAANAVAVSNIDVQTFLLSFFSGQINVKSNF